MKFQQIIKAALVGAACLLWLGFGIGTLESLPPYAVVFLDDNAKTYLALPCLDEWQKRSSQVVTVLRRATAGDAIRLGYKGDNGCREAGGFADDGRSMSGLLFQRVGILPPLEHWWDKPYRTEDGKVVFPGKAS